MSTRPPVSPWPETNLRSTPRIRELERRLDALLQARAARDNAGAGKVAGIASVHNHYANQSTIVVVKLNGEAHMIDPIEPGARWIALPPVPGTAAGLRDEEVRTLRRLIDNEKMKEGIPIDA